MSAAGPSRWARPALELAATVLDARDPGALADFYERLLGWDRLEDGDDWVRIGPPGGGSGLSFQGDPHHEPPTWPAGPGDVQMQLHLDVRVDDLTRAVALATDLGARPAEHQPQDDVRVMLDPAGHPFCLFLPGA